MYNERVRFLRGETMDYKHLASILFPEPLKTPEEWEAIYPERNLPEGAVVTRMAPSPTGLCIWATLCKGSQANA